MHVNIVFKFIDNGRWHFVSLRSIDLYFLDAVVKNFSFGQSSCGGTCARKQYQYEERYCAEYMFGYVVLPCHFFSGFCVAVSVVTFCGSAGTFGRRCRHGKNISESELSLRLYTKPSPVCVTSPSRILS